MKKEEIIINFILSLIVSIIAAIITINIKLDTSIITLITVILISIFWLSSYINEINQKTKDNAVKIKNNEEEIVKLKEDLNIERRLSILENKMSKKGQIEIPDLIKIGIIIVLIILLLRALNIF